MNGAHWHLAVNHLPIIFPVAGAIVMGTALAVKSEVLKRMAFALFILGGLLAFLAMATGEGAEGILLKADPGSASYIERHEEAAETLAVLSYVLGAFSAVGLWASLRDKAFSKLLAPAAMVLVLIVLFFARKAGTTGGEIRHTEIREAHAAVR